MRRYRRISYDRYLDGDKWIVEPRSLPAESLGLAPRDRVVSVLDPGTGALLAVFPVEELRGVAVRDRVETTLGDRRLVLQPVSHRHVAQRDGLRQGTRTRDDSGGGRRSNHDPIIADPCRGGYN